MICMQTIYNGFFFIVVTLIKVAAAFVANIFYLAGVKAYMIGSTASFADTAANYTRNQLGVRNRDINNTGQFNAQVFEDSVESNCLLLSSREAI